LKFIFQTLDYKPKIRKKYLISAIASHKYIFHITKEANIQ